MGGSSGASKRWALQEHRGKWGHAGEGSRGSLSLQAAADSTSGGLAGVEQGTPVRKANLKLSADP